MPDEEGLRLLVGHTYRAKRPRRAFGGGYNDRTIMWMGGTMKGPSVQYDGPSVADGQHYPTVTREAFLAWAASDVTEEKQTP